MKPIKTDLYVEVCLDRATDDWEEAELVVVWNIYGKYVPSRLFGPPEDCYEAEHPEYEIECVYIDTDFGRFYINEDEVMYTNYTRHTRIKGSYRLCEKSCEMCAFLAAEKAADVLRHDRYDLEQLVAEEAQGECPDEPEYEAEDYYGF